MSRRDDLHFSGDPTPDELAAVLAALHHHRTRSEPVRPNRPRWVAVARAEAIAQAGARGQRRLWERGE